MKQFCCYMQSRVSCFCYMGSLFFFFFWPLSFWNLAFSNFTTHLFESHSKTQAYAITSRTKFPFEKAVEMNTYIIIIQVQRYCT